MYKINGEGTVIFKIEDCLNIPADVNNRHYQEYLAWIDEGNEPELVQPEVIND